MITETGYSKDPSIMPEGIAITFGAQMIAEQGGLLNFLRGFNEIMQAHESGDYWMHKMKNKPTFEVDHIYIIVANRLYARVYSGGYSKEPKTGFTMDGRKEEMNWGRLNLSGPMERCPFKRTLKGFQGFRYTTKLW